MIQRCYGVDNLKNQIENASAEELKKMKVWLFRENVRIEAEKKKLEFENKRLQNEKQLFEKKLTILQNAYLQLDIDRKAIEHEKRIYHVNKEYKTESNVIKYVSIQSFFRGVNSNLALKKRYKDLIKIFHPDNLCGDKDTVQMINQEYNVLREKYNRP